MLVYLLRAKKISYVNLNCNKIRIEEFEKLMQLSVESCEKVAEVMREAVKQKIHSNINSFYFR